MENSKARENDEIQVKVSFVHIAYTFAYKYAKEFEESGVRNCEISYSTVSF